MSNETSCMRGRRENWDLRMGKVWKVSVWLNSPWPFPLTAATRTSYVVLGSSPVSTTVAGERHNQSSCHLEIHGHHQSCRQQSKLLKERVFHVLCHATCAFSSKLVWNTAGRKSWWVSSVWTKPFAMASRKSCAMGASQNLTVRAPTLTLTSHLLHFSYLIFYIWRCVFQPGLGRRWWCVQCVVQPPQEEKVFIAVPNGQSRRRDEKSAVLKAPKLVIWGWQCALSNTSSSKARCCTVVYT